MTEKHTIGRTALWLALLVTAIAALWCAWLALDNARQAGGCPPLVIEL